MLVDSSTPQAITSAYAEHLGALATYRLVPPQPDGCGRPGGKPTAPPATAIGVIYMNASRLRQVFACSDTDRMGCSSISGLLAAGTAAAGPYEIR